MHQFHKGLEKRLTALEKRLGSITTTETPAETARRLELCRMALAGETPGDLTEDEKLMFPKIQASVPTFRELIHEGLVDDDGLPAGAADPLDGMLLEDEDGDEDGDGQELAWSP